MFQLKSKRRIPKSYNFLYSFIFLFLLFPFLQYNKKSIFFFKLKGNYHINSTHKNIYKKRKDINVFGFFFRKIQLQMFIIPQSPQEKGFGGNTEK